MPRRLTFWISFLLSMAVPMAAFASAGGSPSFALTWTDVILIFIATLAAFFWLLSVFV